jgi:hypothetical protein
MADPAYARFAHVCARRIVFARGDQSPAPAHRPATSPTPRRYLEKPARPAPPAGTAANRDRVCFACPNF